MNAGATVTLIGAGPGDPELLTVKPSRAAHEPRDAAARAQVDGLTPAGAGGLDTQQFLGSTVANLSGE